jgi:very-short-patch-repair endonuclease
MTKVEEKFYDALCEVFEEEKYIRKIYHDYSFARYRVDFYIKPDVVVEIDGVEHFWERRSKMDYKRERYLISLGLIVIRFTNKEVEEDAVKCVREFMDNVINFRETFVTNSSRYKKDLKKLPELENKLKTINKVSAVCRITNNHLGV